MHNERPGIPSHPLLSLVITILDVGIFCAIIVEIMYQVPLSLAQRDCSGLLRTCHDRLILTGDNDSIMSHEKQLVYYSKCRRVINETFYCRIQPKISKPSRCPRQELISS